MKKRIYIAPEIGIEAVSIDVIMTPIMLAGSSEGPKVGNQAPRRQVF